ncbi:MAG: hypothetical protein R3F33_03830 [Planctomycetota bacterium]
MGAKKPTHPQLVQSLLPSHEAILYLHAGDFRHSAILVDAGRVRLFQLCESAQAFEPIADVRQSFIAWHHNPSKQPPDWKEAAQGLTELLFPIELRDALEELNPSVLYLTGSLDDEYLPWEALPWSDELTFGERFAIAYLPSMVVGVALVERAQTGPPISPTLAQLLVTDEPLTGGLLDFDVDQQSLLDAYGNPDDSWDHLVSSAKRLPLPRSPRRTSPARR